MAHSATLAIPIRSPVFLRPYINYRAKDTAVIYPAKANPINVYYPTDFFATFNSLSLSLKAVL